MKLENEFLYAEISEMGAEVIRIYDKENQRDILWEGESEVLETSLSGVVSERRKNLSKYRTDRRDPVSDKSAWICKRYDVYMHQIIQGQCFVYDPVQRRNERSLSV